ncbi:MAG: TlpA disulfide reductase family protein [Candidatus Kapabacteria bacterium]|nr:TlpA disulfide reductase family protein [Candidatus Kapabacteria bacterium]
MKGKVAPDFNHKTIYDKEISIKDYKGTPIIMIFSEIGCAPCMIALPDLNEITKKYKNIKVISVYPKDKREIIKKHVTKNKILYDIIDKSEDLAKNYCISGYPTFFIIDKNGILNYIQSGYGDGMKEILEKEIEKVLK